MSGGLEVAAANSNAKNWWTYPRVDNFGTKDPAGDYWKPDSNIQIPGLYPIVNLLPGIVTNVQQTSWGQTVVTVKLDSAINSLATHEFYEHMSAAGVNVGEHLAAGQLVGYNNPSGAVPLGYGFFPGDVYGSGTGWTTLQQDLAPGGAGLLNPTAILNAAANGQPFPTSNSVAIANGASGVVDWSWLTNSPLWQWIQDPVRVLKMVVGLMLIGLAIYLLAAPEANQFVKKYSKYLAFA